MKNRLVLSLLLIILLIGIYLRLAGIFTNSFAFTYDVGRDMLALQQIVYHHKFPLIGFTTGLEGVFYGPWWYYILTPTFALSGGNPQFVAYLVALLGITTIILIYFFGKRIGDRFLGLTLALFVSFSPILIGLSNQIWNPNIAPFFIALSLFVILRIFEKPTKRMFFFLGILLALLIDTEIVFGILLFVSYIVGLFIIAKENILKREGFFILPGLLIIFSPRILFEFRHKFLMTNTIFHALANIGNTDGDSLPLFQKESIFFNLFSDTLTGHSYTAGLILLGLLVLGYVMTHAKIKEYERHFFLLSFITIIIFMIGISFFKHDIWPHYLVGLPMFYILATGLILNQARKHIRFGTIIFIVSLILLAGMQLQPLQLIKNIQSPIFEGDAAVYRNQLAVVDFVYNKAKGKAFNEIVYTPPVHDYPYQYLFSWYGPKNYHYAPSTKNEKLFFVIIEPNIDRPELLRDWLKVREHDGVIKDQQRIKGGVIVQTREH